MNTKICPLCQAPIPANAPGGLCPACVLRDAEEPPPAGRAAPSLEEIGVAFPQLEVLRLIGQGGMGFVYQARQPGLDRTVALKILSPELSRDPAFAERFAREARVLGKLNHPNIVTVFEHGESGGFFYLLMEYVEGVNLRQAMRAGRFSPEQALAIVPGICDALQTAHAQGIWHRDIKPENILLDGRGGVKIADFGIARIVGDQPQNFTLTMTGGALGSAAYMAPEQHENPRGVDHRADIYSLGVVIYEMLTGELPLGRFPAPSQRAAVNARIDEIVFRTLEKERELRQQSADEVKTELKGVGKLSSDDPSPLLPRTRDAADRFLFLLAAGLIAGGVFLHHTGRSLGVSSHDIAAIVLSIMGRVAVSLGFVTAAVAAHSRKPRAWVAGLGVFVSMVIVFLLGAGFFPFLMSLGVLVVAGLFGTMGLLGSKRPDPKHQFRQSSAAEVKTDVQGAAMAAEPARKNAAPDGASSLTRLPRLVRWSLGLLVGGGALMGAAALVMDSLKTSETTSMMALLIALGGVASAAGFLGSLWSLYEMKRGWMPATGRWLLIAFTIVPLAVGAIILGGGVGYFAPHPLPAEKGSVLVVTGLQFGILSLALGIIFLLARPLQPATPLRRRLGSACLALAACAAVGSALLAKRGDYHWPHVFYSEGAKLKLFSDLRPQDDEVLALLKRAAGPFADDYELSVSNGVAHVVALTRQNPTTPVYTVQGKYTAKGWTEWTRRELIDTPHASACLTRLRDLLPPSAVRECVIRQDKSHRDPRPRNTLAVLASIAALLAALAGGRRAVWVVIGGVALHAVLIALPVWPSGSAAPPRLIDAAPLPSLTVAELPAPDFSTPELAVASVYDARCFGRLDVAKRGVSKELAALIEAHRDGWEGFMSRFNGDRKARRFAVLSSERDKQDDGMVVVRGTFVSRNDCSTFGDARGVVVLEDGEWKLDSLDSRYRATARARHEAGADKASLSMEETWSCPASHATPAEIAIRIESMLSDGWKALAKAVPPKAEAGVLKVTGPQQWVRQLATAIHAADFSYRVRFPIIQPPTPVDQLAVLLPRLACGEGLNADNVDPTLHLNAPQFARAVSAHVFEFGKATLESTGIPFDNIRKNKGASTTERVTIPCADQPDQPLVVEIRRTVISDNGWSNVVITGLSPWLIEEARRQSAEPLILPKVTTAGPRINPETPVEEVFRKMHAAANASNGDEFARYENPHAGSRINGVRYPIVQRMEPFFGEILFLERFGAKNERSLRTDLIAKLKRADGTTEFKKFEFHTDGERWMFNNDVPVRYQTGILTEFLPPTGEPEIIIRTHMGSSSALAWISGQRGRFYLLGTGSKPEDAVRQANENALTLLESLKRLGLDGYLKVIKPAQIPDRPMLRWDEIPTAEPAGGDAALPAPLPQVATPEAAMQAILKAAQEGNKQALRAGSSRSLQAVIDKYDSTESFNELRHLSIVRARTLNETTAEVILKPTAAAGKELLTTFQMIMEDGAWKLTEVTSQGH